MTSYCTTAFEEGGVVLVVVFIVRSSGLHARACTWSNYKHHNTAKVLLGIAPQGVSKCWKGRVSDRYL